MPFEKGKSGNKSGRPKGSRNKASGQLRELISGFLEDRFEGVVADFDKLKPFAKVKLYTDLLQYALPKMNANANKIGFENMTDEQLDEIIERLKNPGND